jgi:hypothetical protein
MQTTLSRGNYIPDSELENQFTALKFRTAMTPLHLNPGPKPIHEDGVIFLLIARTNFCLTLECTLLMGSGNADRLTFSC